MTSSRNIIRPSSGTRLCAEIPPGHLPPMPASEASARAQLLSQASKLRWNHRQSTAWAREWTLAARSRRDRLSHADAMLDAFGLATSEGGALMRLAEALLRTPDRSTAWQLICENLTSARWQAPVNARLSVRATAGALRALARLIAANESRLGVLAGPATWAMRRGVAAVAEHFIVATSIRAALARMRRDPHLALCSIDCLGESARTAAQAQTYLEAYERAIEQLSRQPMAIDERRRVSDPSFEPPASAGHGSGPLKGSAVHQRHGISVKLSALEPRFGARHRGTYDSRLVPAMLHLARRAAQADILLTIDAEEQERLESTLDIVAALIDDPHTRDWEGLGVVVQAYGLRALSVIDWLAARAQARGRRITVRLVKGAYWDTEIKHAQELGLDAFPVFTDKRATDLSYLVAAQQLFARRDAIYPQFATHNAMTIATVRSLAPPDAPYEFQRLHGMGQQLYAIAARQAGFPRVRVYAPVGSYEDLLAYLIRRLLENGANTSFVRHFLDPSVPVETLLVDPIESLAQEARLENEQQSRIDDLRDPHLGNAHGARASDAATRHEPPSPGGHDRADLRALENR